MPELADVVRRHGERYLENHGSAMLPSHRRALRDILACRTPAMGGHVLECERCGKRHHVYHSCKNRSCPKCQAQDTRAWIDKRQGELLNTTYFHVVFTVPHQLHEIARANQSVFYGALMSVAARALEKLCADPRYLAGQIGLLAVLHTWTRTLVYHPHVHCLVPGLAVSPEGHVIFAKSPNFLVPVRALSLLMRAMLIEELERLVPGIKIPRQARRSKWVVYAKPAVQGSASVLRYLARYVHRSAITNSRILAVDSHNVCFAYQDNRDYSRKTLTLSGQEFLRRYLQHVLPGGFHKVRYYGLWSPAKRHVLRRIQLILPPQPEQVHEACPPATAPKLCPCCLEGTLRLVAVIAREPRCPLLREEPIAWQERAPP